MKLAVHRRSALTTLCAVLLLGGLPGKSFALDRIVSVSPARASELGITVRLQPRPEDVWVQVEFKPTAPEKPFKYTRLHVIQGGQHLISTYLMPLRPTPDTMRFDAYLHPAIVPNTTVTVTVREDAHTGVGYRINLKDLFEPQEAQNQGPALLPAATLPEVAENSEVLVAGEQPVLFKVRDVTLEQVDPAKRTVTVTMGNRPLPVRLVDLPLSEDIRLRVSLVRPGAVNNVPFDWDRLERLAGKRVSMLMRAEASRLSVAAIAVAND